MKISRRDFSAAFLGTALLGRTLADGVRPAVISGDPREGREFRRLAQDVPTFARGRVEVLEFFSYACPHCNAFEPELRRWLASAPADLALRRVPVPFIGKAVVLQRTYYALQVAGNAADAVGAHAAVFGAVHEEKRRIESLDDAAAAVRGRVDESAFRSAFSSDAVTRQVGLADNLVKAYDVNGVPTLAVQGRFLTSREMAGSGAGTLKTVDFLVSLSRQA